VISISIVSILLIINILLSMQRKLKSYTDKPFEQLQGIKTGMVRTIPETSPRQFDN